MTLPPLNLSLASGAKSGEISAPMAWDSSGFSVNYGTGNAGGGLQIPTVPNWVWIAAAVAGAVLWKSKKFI